MDGMDSVRPTSELVWASRKKWGITLSSFIYFVVVVVITIIIAFGSLLLGRKRGNHGGGGGGRKGNKNDKRFGALLFGKGHHGFLKLSWTRAQSRPFLFK